MTMYDLSHVSARNLALVLGAELDYSEGAPLAGEAHDCLDCRPGSCSGVCCPRIKTRVRERGGMKW